MLTVSPPTTPSTTTTTAVAATRPAWVSNNTTTACTSCQHEFSFFFRRHHCRACGQIFCDTCSQGRSTIPELGYFKPTRVCIACVQRCSSHDTPPHSVRKPTFPRSPALPSRRIRSFGREIENQVVLSSPTKATKATMKNKQQPQQTFSVALKATPTARATPTTRDTRATPTARVTSSTSIRLWLPDVASDTCHQCQISFRAKGAGRKHHCRSCARVFCQDCSARTVSSTCLIEQNQRGHTKATRERVCRRCYSRLMSTVSTFGRFNFNMKHIVSIVRWSGVATLGKLYCLNVKWHGIMSSGMVDAKVWSLACVRSGWPNVAPVSIVAHATGVADTSATTATTATIANPANPAQPCRKMYLRKVGMKKLQVAALMLSQHSVLGQDAAYSLMLQTASPWSTSTNVKHSEILKQAIPLLVEIVQGCCSSDRNAPLTMSQLKKVCFSAGTLLNCTRMHTGTCSQILSCGGLPVLLSIVRDISWMSNLGDKSNNGQPVPSNHSNLCMRDTVVHAAGTVWNLFRWESQYGQHLNHKNTCRHQSIQTLKIFGGRLEELAQHIVVENRMLQLATQICGAISLCCHDHTVTTSPTAPALPVHTGAALFALSALIRVTSTMHSIVVCNNDCARQAVVRFFRVACSTLRNALLHHQAARLALRDTNGLRLMVKLLGWQGDYRVAENAAAVLTNATNECKELRKDVDMHCWRMLLRHIGTGGLEYKVSWEYAAGVLLNCTSGGIVLTDERVWRVLFETLNTCTTMMPQQHEITAQTLASLCGAACNLSLVHNNWVYFEELRGREVLERIVEKEIGSASCYQYAKQTVQNLEVHRKSKFGVHT